MLFSTVICIVNAYMSCRGKRNSDIDYRDVVYQISEIINKYSSDTNLNLFGDMKTSLMREKSEH